MLLAICAGNSPVPGEFPAPRQLTRSFDVFLDLRLNKDGGENVIKTKRIYSMRQKTQPVTNDMLAIIWFLLGYLRFKLDFPKIEIS